ncbi:MAG: hypothetical protein ACXVNF_00145 [Neobacillus sp.]
MKDQLIHMRDKLNDISRRNRSIRLVKLYNKWSFDLTELDKLSDSPVSETIVEKIINQTKNEDTNLNSLIKDKVHQSHIARQKQKESRKREKEQEEIFGYDGTFYFVTAYTSNGFPYGITREQMEEIYEEKTRQLKNQVNKMSVLDDEDLPF